MDQVYRLIADIISFYSYDVVSAAVASVVFVEEIGFLDDSTMDASFITNVCDCPHW